MASPDDNGEYFEFDAKPGPQTEDERGGEYIDVTPEDGNEPIASEGEFYDNLALTLPDDKLADLALDIAESVRNDLDAKRDKDKDYAAAVAKTGLAGDAPGGASFLGASKVTHPMITKAIVEFEARAIKEMFPEAGPVKTYIVGTNTKARWQKAERKRKFFNWQMTVQMEELFSELEDVLMQSSMAGEAYTRTTWCHKTSRPTVRGVTADRVITPPRTTSFYTAERITFIDYLTEMTYRERVREGIYLDVDFAPHTASPEKTETGEETLKIAGADRDPYNKDGERRFFEVNMFLRGLEGDLDPAKYYPYLVTLSEDSWKIAAIVRNWEENDPKCVRMHWVDEWPFVPWSDGVRIGLSRMIGSLSSSATGALRALLDSAHVNNVPTAIKLRSAPHGREQKKISLKAGEIAEVDAGVGADDIRKVAMPVPFNPPSSTLFNLLGFLVETGGDMVRTTYETGPDNNNPQQPVGTTMALIEQGLVVLSTIMKRMHKSMGRFLRTLHRINRMYLTEEQVLDETGEVLIRRSDLEGPLDVVPVSDPTVPSEAHRTAKMQALVSRAGMMPMLYDVRKVEKMFLEKLQIADPQEVLLPPQEPQEMNAANENAAAALGRPISAFPQQDHLAHLQVHLDFAQSPIFGMLPVIAPAFLPVFTEHAKEHIVLWYVTAMYEVTSRAAKKDVSEYMRLKDPEVNKELDRLIAMASPEVISTGAEALRGVPPVIMQAIKMIQQFQPQINSQQDPRLALDAKKQQDDAADKQQKNQLKMQELQMRVVEGGKDRQVKQQDLQQRAQDSQQKHAIAQQGALAKIASTERVAAQGEVAEMARARSKIESEERRNTQDNRTALAIAEAEVESSEKVAVKKGTSDGLK